MILILFSKIKSYYWFYMTHVWFWKKEFWLQIKTNVHSDEHYLSQMSSLAANFKTVAMEQFPSEQPETSEGDTKDTSLYNFSPVHVFFLYKKKCTLSLFTLHVDNHFRFQMTFNKLSNQICNQRKPIFTH